MTDDRPVRAFLAIDPPGEVRREIERILNRLRGLLRGEIGWVRPGAIHLTLKFFGDVPRDGIAAISAVAVPAAAAVRPFDLAVGGVGVFPDPRRPRVIWLGMGGETARLTAFQQGMERTLEEIGFPREDRPFRPHLTLGRIRSQRGLAGLAAALDRGETYTAGRFTAAGLGLFKSDLTPQGAIYTRLAEYPFAGEGQG